MNRFLKYWRISGQEEKLQARIVSYADDFVILSRGHAAQAREWTQQVMERLGLSLNQAKTKIADASKEPFDFLGYSFGPCYHRKDSRWYIGAYPSKKSVARCRLRVSDLLHRNNQAPWAEVRDDLNRCLRGWSGYFNQGTRLMAYRALDNHVWNRVRRFLVRRHKDPSRGTRRFAADVITNDYGVLSLRNVHLGPPPCAPG